MDKTGQNTVNNRKLGVIYFPEDMKKQKKFFMVKGNAKHPSDCINDYTQQRR